MMMVWERARFVAEAGEVRERSLVEATVGIVANDGEEGEGRSIANEISRLEASVDDSGEASCTSSAHVLVEKQGGNGARPF